MQKKLIFSISLLALIIINCYLDRSAMAYSYSYLMSEFKLSDAQFGFLMSIFSCGYLVMTMLGGLLVDRFGARPVLALSLLFWSLAALIIAASYHYYMLLFGRLLLGLAEGACFPSYTRVQADQFSAEQRVRCTSLGLLAVPFSSVIGAPLIVFLLAHLSWRVSFLVMGIPGFVLAFLWYHIYRDPPQHTHEKPEFSWHILCSVLGNTNLLLSNLGYFAWGYTLYFTLGWFPAFLSKSFAYSLEKTGWLLMIAWLSGTVLLLLGGLLSDYLWKRTKSLRIARSLPIGVALLASAVFFLLLLNPTRLVPVLVGMSLGLGMGLFANAIFFSLNIDLAFKHAATSMGVMNACSSVAGIIAPWLTGVLLGLDHQFSSALFLLSAINAVAGVSILLFQCRKEAFS